MSEQRTIDLRLYGYATGEYWIAECSSCGEEFTGDKRATVCLPCAQGMEKRSFEQTKARWDWHTKECAATNAREDGMQNWPSACDCAGNRPSNPLDDLTMLKGVVETMRRAYMRLQCADVPRGPWHKEVSDWLLYGSPPDETFAKLSGIDFLFAWMAAPNPQLGGVSPLAMLDTGLGHKVAAFIRQAQFDSTAENGTAAPHK